VLRSVLAARHGIPARLFLTVWLVYAAHLSTNVARETYLAIALGERFSLRVDEYLGLHPDLFAIDGRGAYINNNPGASMLGAIPYAIARPGIAILFALKPALGEPKPPAIYDDPRPNRNKFMNEARRRGVDIKLGLAAIVTQVGLMAPLGALAALLVFLFLDARLLDTAGGSRRAIGYALLFAFATPMLFRSAFLNQNAIVAHCVLWAFIALVGLTPRDRPASKAAVQIAGACLGLAILTDYSGAPLAIAFGLWVMVEGHREERWRGLFRRTAWFASGAAGPLAILFAYQWVAFGDPFLPAQKYMPDTSESVKGWFGMSPPTPRLLAGNLIGPDFGLFSWCPMLLAAFATWRARGPGVPDRTAQRFVWIAGALLYLFSSANQYANLQWNTGVRYMVPMAPLLFILAVPVLDRAPRLVFWALVLPSCVFSACVSMTRENLPEALMRVFIAGPELPLLTVLGKTASGYMPLLEERGPSPLAVYALLGAVLYLLWKPRSDAAPGRDVAGGPGGARG
jgi:hypothetical protein